MTKRQVFFSFHYNNDSWRVSQVRNAGVVEGNSPVSSNDWEAVKRKGDTEIKKWIEDQLSYRSCTVVLIGSQTASREWVKHEIQRSWELRKGIVGIHIHNLKDSNEKQDSKGTNPFDEFTINKVLLSSVVKSYDPPFSTSTYVYDHIKENLATWVEEAIAIRNRY